MSNHYIVICDRSGQRVKAKDCRMQWDGLLVKKEYWEARHPQDKVKVVADKAAPPIVRPEGEVIAVSAVSIGDDDL